MAFEAGLPNQRDTRIGGYGQVSDFIENRHNSEYTGVDGWTDRCYSECMSNELNEYRQDVVAPKTHRALKVTLIAIGAVVALTASTWAGSVAVTAYNQDAVRHAHIIAQSLVPAAPVGDATTADSQSQMADSDAAGAQAVQTEQAAEAAAALAAQQAAQAAAARQATQDSIIHCPAGTVAGAYDAQGNESNCQPENGSGEICQAYDANNVCTAWGKE